MVAMSALLSFSAAAAAEEMVLLSQDGETLLVEAKGEETIQNLEADGWQRMASVPNAKKDVKCTIVFPDERLAKVECATAFQGPKLIISAEFDRKNKAIGKSVNLMLTNHRKASAAIEVKL